MLAQQNNVMDILKHFKRHHSYKQRRDEHGRFSADNGSELIGSPRKGLRDIEAITTGVKQVFEMEKAVMEAMRSRSEAIRAEAEAIAASRNNGDTDTEDSLLEMLVGALVSRMQEQGQRTAVNEMSPIPDKIAGERKEALQPTEKQNFNEMLKTISKIPSKAFTKDNISRICEDYGIDERYLKKAIQKIYRAYD